MRGKTMTKGANRLWVEDEEISKRIKERRVEESKRRECAESNPLIWFPAQMLAAGGNLTMSTNQSLIALECKAYNVSTYNVPTRQYPQGILDVRNLIDEAYWFYLDILEDPWHVANDELIDIDEDDLFLNPPDEITDLGEKYQKWEIEQVRNRKPKATDTKRLRIATFFVDILEYEDLFMRTPDEIFTFRRHFTITKLLQEQWRLTTSKLLDFAVELATKLNATNDINYAAFFNKIIEDQNRLYQRLADIQSDSHTAAVKSTEAANVSNAIHDELIKLKPKLEAPDDILKNLAPESKWTDAKEYMARLVCYVWGMIPGMSKPKSVDYVFREAKEGMRLYADCSFARNLLQQYQKQPSTIMTEAAILHSKLTSFRKHTGLEWPDNWREMVRKSKAKEGRRNKTQKHRTRT